VSERLAKWAAPLAVGVLVVVLWHVLVKVLDVPKFLVPGPLVVLQTLVADWSLLVASLLVTLKITFGALVLAVVVGTAVAFLFVQSRWVEVSLFPYAVLLQVTPIVAIAPLVIIWVEDTTLALIVCAAIVALFPIISNTTLGLRSVNPGLLNLFRMSKASRWQTLTQLRIPSAAVLLRRPADLLGPRADRRGRGRVRRRDRWRWRGSRVPDPPGRLPDQHSAPVRRAAHDHGGRRGAVSPDGVPLQARARELARVGSRARDLGWQRRRAGG
jgi:hypothetical protein